MLESAAGFESLPPEYQQVILLSQEQHGITIRPLKELVGGCGHLSGERVLSRFRAGEAPGPEAGPETANVCGR